MNQNRLKKSIVDWKWEVFQSRVTLLECTNDNRWVGFNKKVEVDKDLGGLLNVDP